ncbi:MAG: hypothetical protein PVH40_07425 [Gemmatimonadales bacterium]|jgi:protein TonB
MSHRNRHMNIGQPRPKERFGGGVVASAAIHGAVIVVLAVGAALGSDEVFRSVGGPGPRGGGGGGGGTVIQHIDLPPLETAGAVEVQQEERPAPQLQLPNPSLAQLATSTQRVELREVTGQIVPALRLGRGPGSGGGEGAGTGSGGGVGSGQGTGVGSGRGPGTGGEGGSIFPPEPKFIIVPADRPNSVRGKEYAVHFWVNAEGRVTRVEVDPEISDRDYRRKFVDQMFQFQFTPARTLDGEAVEGEIVIPIAL